VGAITVEEVMEQATRRYIDFPGVGIIDLDAPEIPGKVLKVATEQMFAETTILETIASVSRALHQYEHAGGFAPSVASEVVGPILGDSAAGTESVAPMSAPPSTNEGQEASSPASRGSRTYGRHRSGRCDGGRCRRGGVIVTLPCRRRR
jgi:hypothetical protein